MTPDQFVAAMRQVAFEPAVSPAVLEPHGQSPHPAMVGIWEWYSDLSDRDRALVVHAMRFSAWSSIFGVFAAIDGVRAFDDGPHGHLTLAYVDSSGVSHALNDPLGRGTDEALHDLWNAAVFPPAEPLPTE
jgi:hypothetical protein